MAEITIKSKYNIGDKVFMMERNKVLETVVTGIFVEAFHFPKLDDLSEPTPKTTYFLFATGSSSRFSENDLFSTKKELLESL